MLYDLYAVDISEFNVRAKPDTNELLEQKLLSLQPIERWWYDCLDRGEFKNGDFHSAYQEEVGCEWTDFLSTDEAIKGVMETAGGKVFRKPNANEVIKVLMKICPSASKGQKNVENVRRRGLKVPPLQQARIEFEKYIGGAVNWLEDEI
jgi:hypothetical protein